MMIPPVIRLGPPLEPQANCVEYVCLVQGWGWRILQWNPDRGFFVEDVLYPGSNGIVDITYYRPEQIYCWMPQDGS